CEEGGRRSSGVEEGVARARGGVWREAVRRLAARRWVVRGQVIDVVCSIEADPPGNAVQPRVPAHAVCDDVIGAGAVAAEAQATNDLTPRVQSHTAPERDDAARHPANAGP